MNGRRKMQKAVCAFLLGTTLFSCSDQKEIQITGTVRNLNGGMIVYQQSIAGMMNSKTVDTLQIQSDSTFISFGMEKRCWVRLYRKEEKYNWMWMQRRKNL